jgi:hypothetical protein
VHVIVFDDFRDRTADAYAGVLRFLGVNESFRPDFDVRNPNRRVRSAALQRAVFRPPGPLRRLVPWLRRFPLVHRLREGVLRLNSAARRRPAMDPALRRRLLDELAPEIEELGRLIGRDLSAWLERTPVAA